MLRCGQNEIRMRSAHGSYSNAKPLKFLSKRLTKSNKILDVSISAAVYKNARGEEMGLVVNITDIAEQIKIRNELIQARKNVPGIRIDLLITDVVMPSMNGRELAEKILLSFSHMKCLYMSGYTANIIADRGILDEGLDFINKPFSKQELSVKLREILGKNDN